MELKIGQILYRRNGDSVKEYEIEKIGRKYFYTKRSDYPISKETLKYESKEYSQYNFQLFLDKQTILDKTERDKLFNNIGLLFRNYTVPDCLTLPILRTISNIIEGNP